MNLVSENYELNVLTETDIFKKIQSLPMDIQKSWSQHKIWIPAGAPGRDIEVFSGKGPQVRKGISDKEEQGKLLHSLANIELQAMELAFRSFVEYPQAPKEFREQMADLALSEGKHLGLCLEQLEALGYKWGDWPVHLGLWQTVAAEDSLLDRLLIVHRYLEACGLDSGVALLKRLGTTSASHVIKAVKVIAEEEVGHVAFGSDWYRYFCREQRLDPDHDFRERLQSLKTRLPKRIGIINNEARRQAGFTEAEIQASHELRLEFLKK